MQVSMGCHVKYIAQPHPDSTDSATMEAGTRKRFVLTPPNPKKERLRRLSEFVKKWCYHFLTPVDAGADTSVEAWLKKTNYPQARRDELQELWNRNLHKLTKRDYFVKSFVKDETYPEYKHARIINSRTDMFKCAVGPIFRLIEEGVFKHPAFIKKVPIHLRPQYIRDRLYRVGAKFFWSDFTSFESHFTKEIALAIEVPMYEYMSKYLPDGKYFMFLVVHVIFGRNRCIIKYFVVIVEARRMSGEMNTSLGNGFTNLMLIIFVFYEVGEIVDPVVEGDDSNTSYDQQCATAADFAELGFTIKCGTSDNFEEMSFCGMIFDPVDLVNVTDPCDVLSSFGWARSVYTRYSDRKLLALLRCKALSYAHQYCGAPIIQSLAQYALRVTARTDVRSFILKDRRLGEWDRARYTESYLYYKENNNRVPSKPVPERTRWLVERMFNISVNKQLEIETYLDGLNDLQILEGPILDLPYDPSFADYFDRYSVSKDRKARDLDFPGIPCYNMPGWRSEFKQKRVRMSRQGRVAAAM